MRKLYLLTFILFWSIGYNISNARDISKYYLEGDTIVESGYFILIQKKEIVKRIIKNEKLKKEGKKYMNYYSLAGFNNFFISYDSINDNDSRFKFLLNNRLNSESNSIYTLYVNLNQLDFKSLQGLENQFEIWWPSFIGSSFYDLTGKNNEYCFQLYRLSAKWVRFRMESKEDVFNLIGREADNLTNYSSCYEVYVLKDIISFDNRINLDDLPIRLWKLYPSWLITTE